MNEELQQRVPAPGVRLSQSLPLPHPQPPGSVGARKDQEAVEDDEAADALVGGQGGEDNLCSEKEIGEIDRRLAALQAFLAQAQRGTGMESGGGVDGVFSQSA